MERRVRGGASAGRQQQQQQQQQQQRGAGEIEINNIFICCNIRKTTIVYVSSSSMPQYYINLSSIRIGRVSYIDLK